MLTLFLNAIFTWLFLMGIYSLSKFWYKFFLVLHILIFVPYFIASEMLDGISASHITALYFTDTAEGLSYIKVVPRKYLLLALLIIAPIFYFVRVNLPVLSKKKSWLLLSIVLMFFSFKTVLSLPDLKKEPEYLYKSIYVSPLRVLARTFGVYFIVKRDIDLQRDLQKLPDSWKVINSNPEEDVYIFVIGESVRRDFVEIYNPRFKNSSFLSSIPKIQFNNVLSYAGTTLESLSNAIVSDDAQGKTFFPNNIVTLSRKADFEVNWISNQGSIAGSDNFIAAMAKTADFFKFTTRGKGVTFQSDDKLLDIFQQQIQSKTKRKKVIFLHLMGSHPAPCDIPMADKYKEFVISNDISCYNETLKRTDNFLKNVYDIAQKNRKSFKIVYFADHGLLVDNYTLYHGSKHKQNYEIPFVIIDPKLNETVYIDEYRNLKDFLTFYTQFLNIKTENLKPSYQFISDEKAKNAFELYDNFNYENLSDNPIPE